ncbi:MFS transporter [Exophiala viscosa]|uniref:MFS transporter n=1 Tax=Exophiala viscosa TaxID=2486360 RepID=A0AAN6DRQ5_9EURO|nr:MFS transporter [Exophiala viscosa]KAI1628950.1 MFS transporter [Exophiala viscosa]
MALPPKWYQFLVSVFASLGSYLYGYDLGVIAEVVASSTFTKKFHPDDTQSGLVVSMFTTGAFFGAALGGPSGDYFGRRWTITFGAVIFCLGGGLQTGAQTIHFLWSGRFLAGLGVGFLVMIIPLYQAELAHPSIRGRITALQQFMLGVGALVASWISWATYVHIPNNSAQWRVPLGLQIIPAVFLALLIFMFPESPRWLMDHNKADKALKVLAQLHAHGNEEDPWVMAEYEQIQSSIAFEHENEAKSYFELFRSRSSFRRLFLCCALQASVQMTGVSAIQYYSVTIYGQIGISGNDTLKYQGINSIIALIAQFCTILFIDKTGRRWPLILGNLGNMVTFIIATILLAKFPPGLSTNHGAQWGFIIMTWLYNFSFSCTCGPLSWIIPAEVFDTHTRSKGVSFATMTSFAFNTMIGQVTPIAMTNIGYRFYFVFIICNFTNAIFFWALLPETARRPLEEMNYLFENAPWIVVGTTKDSYASHDLENRLNEIAQRAEIKRSESVMHDEKVVH